MTGSDDRLGPEPAAPGPAPLFHLVERFDGPELLGASWWCQLVAPAALPGKAQSTSTARTLAAGRDAETRRTMMLRLLGIGVGTLAVGSMIFAGSGTRAPKPILVGALDLQKRRGWNVDAVDRTFSFPDAQATDVAGNAVGAAERAALAAQLRPRRPALLPLHVETLLESLGNGPLAALVPPIRDAAMARAFAIGQAVAELFAAADAPRDTALVVDLPGPESVAFAAGARAAFAPVFTFANWPHPLGVVPAHRTLGACLYYRPLLAAPDTDDRARAAFVLDHSRLAPYADEPDRFDNRYTATLPNAAQLRALGTARVLCVVPAGVAVELDDLNEDFDQWRAAGLDVRLLALDQFAATDAQGARTPVPTYGYFGHPNGGAWFWWHYFGRGGFTAGAPPMPLGAGYVPRRRATPFDLAGGRSLGLVHDRSAERAAGSSYSGSRGRSRSYGFG